MPNQAWQLADSARSHQLILHPQTLASSHLCADPKLMIESGGSYRPRGHMALSTFSALSGPRGNVSPLAAISRRRPACLSLNHLILVLRTRVTLLLLLLNHGYYEHEVPLLNLQSTMGLCFYGRAPPHFPCRGIDPTARPRRALEEMLPPRNCLGLKSSAFSHSSISGSANHSARKLYTRGR